MRSDGILERLERLEGVIQRKQRIVDNPERFPAIKVQEAKQAVIECKKRKSVLFSRLMEVRDF